MKSKLGKFKVLLILSFLLLVLSGCGWENLTALVPKGYGAESSMNLIILTTVVMTFVFLEVTIIYVIVHTSIRKRKGEEDIIPVQVERSKALETIWTIMPIIFVLIMSVTTVSATFDLADASDQDEHLNINVTGKQYWWLCD